MAKGEFAVSHLYRTTKRKEQHTNIDKKSHSEEVVRLDIQHELDKLLFFERGVDDSRLIRSQPFHSLNTVFRSEKAGIDHAVIQSPAVE